MKRCQKFLLTAAILNVIYGSVVMAAPAVSDQQQEVQKQFSEKSILNITNSLPATNMEAGSATFHLKKLE